jgi:Flp pilus assembly pilin Flp
MIRFLMNSAVSTLRDRKGVTAAEYAVMAVGIVSAVAAATLALKGTLTTLFTNLDLTP